MLDEKKIETRPIVTGNFTKNTVMRHFDFQIHNNLRNADIIDSQGFFLSNNHEDLTEQINFKKIESHLNQTFELEILNQKSINVNISYQLKSSI